jgi:hypothetical protein
MISGNLLIVLMLSAFMTGIQPTATGCSGCSYLSDDYLVVNLTGEQLTTAIDLALASPAGAEVVEYLTRRGYEATLDKAIAQIHSWEEGTRQVLIVLIAFGDDAAMTYALGICGKDSARAYIVKQRGEIETTEIYTIRPDGVKTWQIIKILNSDDRLRCTSTYIDSDKEFWYQRTYMEATDDGWSGRTWIFHANTTIVETWRIEQMVQYDDEQASVHTLSQYTNSYGDSETIEVDLIGIMGNGGGGRSVPCTGDPPSCEYPYVPVCACDNWDLWCLAQELVGWALYTLSCFLCFIGIWYECFICALEILYHYGHQVDFEKCCLGNWVWICFKAYHD